MNGDLIFACFLGGGVSLALLAVLVATVTMSPARRLRSADRAARRLELPLTPDLAERLGARLRTRVIVALAVSTVLAGPVFFLWGYRYGALSDVTDQSPTASHRRTAALPPQLISAAWIIGALATVAGHLADLARVRMKPGSRVARLTVASLGDVLPGYLIACVRACTVLPAIAACAWLLVPAGARGAVWPYRFSVAELVLLVVAAPGLWVLTEAVQTRILRGPQRAANGLELAVDDGLRAQAAIALSMLPVAYACLSAQLIAGVASPLVTDRIAADITFVFADFAIVPGLILAVVLMTRRTRLWYRARLVPAAMPAPTPPAPSHAG
jgi:hypothetical protein